MNARRQGARAMAAALRAAVPRRHAFPWRCVAPHACGRPTKPERPLPTTPGWTKSIKCGSVGLRQFPVPAGYHSTELVPMAAWALAELSDRFLKEYVPDHCNGPRPRSRRPLSCAGTTLLRRTWRRRVRAIHAAIAGFELQYRPAMTAIVEPWAGVRRHRLGHDDAAARRTGNAGLLFLRCLLHRLVSFPETATNTNSAWNQAITPSKLTRPEQAAHDGGLLSIDIVWIFSGCPLQDLSPCPISRHWNTQPTLEGHKVLRNEGQDLVRASTLSQPATLVPRPWPPGHKSPSAPYR